MNRFLILIFLGFSGVALTSCGLKLPADFIQIEPNQSKPALNRGSGPRDISGQLQAKTEYQASPAWIGNVDPDMLPYINEARSEGRNCGDEYFPPVGPVEWNEDLATAALRHTSDMATNAFAGHTGSDGSSAGERIREATNMFRATAEIVNLNRPTYEGSIQGWLNSPGHCRIIMMETFTHIGASVSEGPHRDRPDFIAPYRVVKFAHGMRSSEVEELKNHFSGKNIRVYGASTCGRTDYFILTLRQAGLDFSAYYTDRDDAANSAMWAAIHQQNARQTRVDTPVIVVDDIVVTGVSSLQQLYEETK
ncbi:MAG: CAP domain-containing protein [Balneolales bacterium]|nr:CAP domain-containing protein [Balneolales bacterium]